MPRLQAHGRVIRQRLLEADSQPVLITSGDERHPGGGTHGRVGVGLKQPHAVSGQAVDVRSLEIGPPVTGYVGVPEIIGENEEDIRRSGRRGFAPGVPSQCQRGEAGGRAAQEVAPRDRPGGKSHQRSWSGQWRWT